MVHLSFLQSKASSELWHIFKNSIYFIIIIKYGSSIINKSKHSESIIVLSLSILSNDSGPLPSVPLSSFVRILHCSRV